MEPRQFEKSAKSRGEVQILPARQPERKRRFQIVKLEERIALGGNGKRSDFMTCGFPCGGTYSKHC